MCDLQRHGKPAIGANPMTDQSRILPDLTAIPSADVLLAQLAALQAENARLRSAKSASISFRVNDWKQGDLDSNGKKREKDGARGVSIIGLQVKPVTLFANQWLKVRDLMPDLVAFMEANRSRISWEK
jgi:hypothetical protein